MSNITVTNNDLNSPILSSASFQDDVLTFAGAGTVAAGTILARSSATDKLIPYVKGGITAGNGIPKAILTYDVTAAGAGDVAIRAGIAGQYRKEKLIIAADGDDSNIDAAVLDALRLYGLTPINVDELNIVDNQ